MKLSIFLLLSLIITSCLNNTTNENKNDEVKIEEEVEEVEEEVVAIEDPLRVEFKALMTKYRCTQCHSNRNHFTGYGTADDIDLTIEGGWIVPGSPDLSRVYQVMLEHNDRSQAGQAFATFSRNISYRQIRMPYGNGGNGPYLDINSDDAQAIRDFINSLAPTNDDNNDPPAEDLTAEFTRIIQQNGCTGCHGNLPGSGGFGVINDTQEMIINGYITPGFAETSKLYQYIIENGNRDEGERRMPISGQYINANDLELVRRYIVEELAE